MFKRILNNIFDIAGGNQIGRMLNTKKFPILMYHRFSFENEPFKLSANVFEQHISILKKNYTVLSLEEISMHLTNGQALPKNIAAITVDDGYADVYDIAFPLLKKHQIPATVFLATNFIEYRSWLWSNRLEFILKNSKKKEFSFALDQDYHFNVSTFSGWHKAQLRIYNYGRTLPAVDKNLLLDSLADVLSVKVPDVVIDQFAPLNWDQIREMRDNGIHFGSHTRGHEILSRLSAGEAEVELRESKHLIEEKLNQSVTTFCYPNGTAEDYTKETISMLKETGYDCAVTTIDGLNNGETDRFQLRRMGCGEDLFYFKRKLAFG